MAAESSEAANLEQEKELAKGKILVVHIVDIKTHNKY